jgi:hypothetical protein
MSISYEQWLIISVSCPFQKNGCENVSDSIDITNHVMHCEFSQTLCDFCNQGILVKDVITHRMDACSKLPRNIGVGTKLKFRSTYAKDDNKGHTLCMTIWYDAMITKTHRTDPDFITIEFKDRENKSHKEKINKWDRRIQYNLE